MHLIKYFTSEEVYNREIDMMAAVAALDPGATFTTSGEPLALAEAPDDHLVECPGAVRAIRYMYGGPTINEIIKNNVSSMSLPELNALVSALVQLMRHVITMNRGGRVHGDAHNENVVYRDGVARLIDFEQMRKTPTDYKFYEPNDMSFLDKHFADIYKKRKDSELLNKIREETGPIPMTHPSHAAVLDMYAAALDAATA